MPLDPSFTERSLAPESPLAHVYPYVPASRRDAYTAVIALDEQIRRATTVSNDPEPRYARLAWWGEEFTRLSAGTPVHPITQALGRVPGMNDESMLFEQLLGAAARELKHIRFAGADDMQAHARTRQGSIQTLVALALSGPRPPGAATRAAASRLGEAWWLTQSICGRGTADVSLIAERPVLAATARDIYKDAMSAFDDDAPDGIRRLFAVQTAIGNVMLDAAMKFRKDHAGPERIPALRATWRAWRAARGAR